MDLHSPGWIQCNNKNAKTYIGKIPIVNNEEVCLLNYIKLSARKLPDVMQIVFNPNNHKVIYLKVHQE